MKALIDTLCRAHELPKEDWMTLLSCMDEESKQYLFEKAKEVRERTFGKRVFVRGLIEISNTCTRNCLYCGIRAANDDLERYHLSKEEILATADIGYRLGFRTFVMQGGEDFYYNQDRMTDIIRAVKARYPECAITLSIGEKDEAEYKAYFEAGADRYLLRHETATKELYERLHPDASFENRGRCLETLKSIGFQVGAGFMVGLPWQTNENYADDLMFLSQLKPHMVGIGPFIPHKDTPLADKPAGEKEQTLIMVALTRLILPNALLPATTALATIAPTGRTEALAVGANVIMPNLSPNEARKRYNLYDGKKYVGGEAAERLADTERELQQAGFCMDMSRGDYASHEEE